MNRTAPRRTPGVFWAGLLGALSLGGAGVTLVQVFAVERGWTDAAPWIRTAAARMDGVRSGDHLVTAIAMLATLAGLVLVALAVLPPRRSHRSAGSALWVSRAAIAAIATDAAQRCSGVVEARTTVRRRAIRLDIATRRSTEGEISGSTSDQVAEAVRARIGDLSALPVRVLISEDLR